MGRRIRIGIIGCGGISRAHIAGYRKLKEKGMGDFVISSLCDLDENRAKDMAELVQQFQDEKLKVYVNYEDMLREGVVDAVDIITTVSAHHSIAISCLEKGVHATVEKPFAVTVKAAQKMVNVAHKSHAVLALSENARRAPNTRASKWLIDQGYIGDVQAFFSGGVGFGFHQAHGRWRGDNILVGTPWRHEKLKAGAGAVLDGGSHLMDTLRYTIGEVEEAFGAAKTFDEFRIARDDQDKEIDRVKNTVEDLSLAILKFENGAIGQYSSGWGGHGEASRYGPWIYGSKGCIKEDTMTLDDGTKQNVVDLFIEEADEELKKKAFPYGFPTPHPRVGFMGDTFALELYDFIEAIAQNRMPETDGAAGLKSISICYAIVESALLNRPVKVSDIETGRIGAYQSEINAYYGI